MKVKTLKAHYFDGYKVEGTVYNCDVKHGERAVRNGLVKELNQPTREEKVVEKKVTKRRKK